MEFTDLLQDTFFVNLTGAALCFVPLAVTIIGFIGFAYRTDQGVYQTYLRVMELRPETEAPEVGEPVLTERTVAKTPSKSRLVIDPTAAAGEQVQPATD